MGLYTDVEFSNDMFNRSKPFNASEDFDDFLTKNNFNFLKSVNNKCYAECYADMDFAFNKRYTRNSTIVDVKDEEYWQEINGWIALWHCIQPFVATLIVFLSMKCCKGGKGSAPNQTKYLRYKTWWCFSSVLCCIPTLTYIGSVVPLPGLTHLYRFYLDIRCHHARSKLQFRTKIVKIEDEISEHEALGELWKMQKIISPDIKNTFFQFIILFNSAVQSLYHSQSCPDHRGLSRGIFSVLAAE